MTVNTRDLLLRIEQLNTELQWYKKHHSNCNVRGEPVPTSVPLDSDASASETYLTSISAGSQSVPYSVELRDGGAREADTRHEISPSEFQPVLTTAKGQLRPTNDVQAEAAELRIISFQPQSCPLSRPAKKQCLSWMKSAARILDKVPTAQEWTPRCQELGLETADGNNNVIAAIAGFCAIKDTPRPFETTHLMSSTDQLIRSATRYGLLTKHFEAGARFALCITSFQKIVFASLCAVLQHSGVSTDLIDEVMRVCLSNSERKHLARLRSGAIWVNRMIRTLDDAGWDGRAAEVFLLCMFLNLENAASSHSARRWSFMGVRRLFSECKS